MRKIIIFVAVLLALPFVCQVDAQVAPESVDAIVAGPVFSNGALGVQIGGATHLGGIIYFAGFGEFGKTVEVKSEMVALFRLTEKLSIGPVAGIGVDWSSEPGTKEDTQIISYLFGASGVSMTYALPPLLGFSLGLYGYGNYQFSGDSYDNKLTAGGGLIIIL